MEQELKNQTEILTTTEPVQHQKQVLGLERHQTMELGYYWEYCYQS
jgi:hypothetical protein